MEGRGGEGELGVPGDEGRTLMISEAGSLNSCTLKRVSSARVSFLACISFRDFSTWTVMKGCMFSSWFISYRTFLFICWLLPKPPAERYFMLNSKGAVSGTESQLPNYLKHRASQGLRMKLENFYQSSDRLMMDSLISSSLVCIFEYILIMRMRQLKQPSCRQPIFSLYSFKSSMRVRYSPTVISMSEAEQKRYLRQSSQMSRSELNMFWKSFSVCLWMMELFSNLKRKETRVSMYLDFLTTYSSLLLESSRDMLKISRSLEWQRVRAGASLISVITCGSSSVILLTKGCVSSRQRLRFESYRFWRSSVLKEEREQQRIIQPTTPTTEREMLLPCMRMSSSREMFGSFVTIYSMDLPSEIRQYFSTISIKISLMFYIMSSFLQLGVVYCLWHSKAVRICVYRFLRTSSLSCVLSGMEMLLRVRSRLRQSRRVFTMALLQECLASSNKGSLASYTRSIVYLQCEFQIEMLNCEKQPQRRGSSSAQVLSRSQKAVRKQGWRVRGLILKKLFTMQVVLLSMASTISRGSLYFLAWESVYWGG